MTQLRIAADSSCDLLALEGLDFVAVPLTIRTDTEEFRDDAALDVNKMVSTLRNTKGRSYSACPNIADWEDAFGEEGDVIAFTITSSLSGSYSAACAARKACIERNPTRRIHVVDTLSAGPEMMLLIEKVLSALRSGADFHDVCRVVEAYQHQTHLLFALESMHNLAQNGRVSKLAATMAGVLGIRALGQASLEGTLEMLEKCRGLRKTRRPCCGKWSTSATTEAASVSGIVRMRPCAGACHRDSSAFPRGGVKSYPLRGLCSYYAEYGSIMLGFES